jgi:hypothetical protein
MNPPSSPLSIGPGTPKQAASIAQGATQKIASDFFETFEIARRVELVAQRNQRSLSTR